MRKYHSAIAALCGGTIGFLLDFLVTGTRLILLFAGMEAFAAAVLCVIDAVKENEEQNRRR